MINNKTKRKGKSWIKGIGLFLAIFIILLLTIPLLIPIQSASGLAEPIDMVTEEGRLVTVNYDGTDGIDLYSVERLNPDKDKNFILLHGSLYNTYTWNLIIDDLSQEGNVYAYDQIPYGYSEKLLEGDWTGNNPYTSQAALDQLNAYIETMKLNNVILVGSSFGGVLAADYAVTYPQKVDALLLVDPAIMVTETMPEWLVKSAYAEHLGPVLARNLASGDGFYKSTYYDQEKLSQERLTLCKSETLINNWDLALWEYLQAWSTAPSDVNTRLTEVTMPTLVISGDEDSIVPLEQSQSIANLIPNATLSIIDDCGHLPHEENPEAFMTIVNQWLTTLK